MPSVVFAFFLNHSNGKGQADAILLGQRVIWDVIDEPGQKRIDVGEEYLFSLASDTRPSRAMVWVPAVVQADFGSSQ